jgi:hypothetical protein
LAEVEDCVLALDVPSWPVFAEEPVEVVVPAVPWEPVGVCAEPLAEVEFEAVAPPPEFPELPFVGL